MAKRIEKISDSPCYNCGNMVQCSKRVRENYKLGIIRDSVFGNKEFDYHNCGIWIALNSSDMIEVDDG